ncbi:FMN-binding protein [Prevotella sp. E2-28]|jgi:electron transport complex protein RnfG|uniref:FMN-binding protein n=1 Tax=Prevotella sp. E2-28 TaxID=2913620 RepID=UPI001EDBBC11|nr:FMN-binding protein [Prevotella sp. E2-28]UKK54045.1 FMN-binding protein [Prevotella sp. E2-28]
MKKIAMICAAVAAVVLLSSANKKDDKVMVKENGAYVINTTELGKGVDGYVGPTPLKVYIRKNKIEKIEFLPNQETPKYWNACKKHLLNKWDGMKVSEAKTAEVDGRTGATFSSDAVKKNVKLALEYYEKNK